MATLEAQTFDLVLLDVMMPDMDGVETLTANRRTRSMSELPVIMATAVSTGPPTWRRPSSRGPTTT